MVDFDDLISLLTVRSPSNKTEGAFFLYQSDISEIESSIIIAKRENEDLNACLSVRIQSENNLNSSFNVKYRGNDDIFKGFLEVMGTSYLESSIEVRTHNKMFGMFELLEPPRVEKHLIATEDATTRSRIDLMTINYGDMQRMMVGKDSATNESFESFIKFNNIKTQLADLSILEKANLRLYYTGDFVNGTNLELYLPSAQWVENGITHANKPGATELITSTYTINTVERYIEFNIEDIVLRWINGSVKNYGFVLKSKDAHTTSFQTRESTKKPFLDIKYITNTVYSMGRAEKPSTMFVWGRENPEINATLTVHSDYGFHYLTSKFHVHTPNEPMIEEIDSFMAVTKEDQKAIVAVARQGYDDMIGQISIQERSETVLESNIGITRPDMISWLTIDPNISLESRLSVAKTDEEILESLVTVSKPDIHSIMTIREVVTLDSTLTVVATENVDFESLLYVSKPDIRSYLAIRVIDNSETVSMLTVSRAEQQSNITVSKPDLNAHLIIRAVDNNDINSNISVRNLDYEDQASQINVSIPDLNSHFIVRAIEQNDVHVSLGVKGWENDEQYSFISVTREEINSTMYIRAYDESKLDLSLSVRRTENEELDSHLGVTREEVIGYLYPRVIGEDDLNSYVEIPHYEWMQSTFTVHEINEINATMDIRQVSNIQSNLAVTREEVIGYLYPRVIGDEDLMTLVKIRQRDASDLNSYLVVAGGLGAYYFII